ncbi:MAG: phosphotriesterase-related protein [Deltaproteobacteria bacterium]|nr:phosphotriesterase-related protein [Deltaproteobacteria bacterium]
MNKQVDILEGAVDLHFHAAPDLHDRPLDEIEIARAAREAGMRALLSKDHYGINAGRMHYVRKAVSGIHAFGGVVLNPAVGGLNPSAVEAAIAFGGKEVWMPSIFSDAHIKHFGGKTYAALPGRVKWPEKGISVLDDEGRLLPAVKEILDMIAQADIILGTSHCSEEESRILIDEAFRRGVKKILVTHPHNVVPNLSAETQLEFARKGAYLEHCFAATTPKFFNARVDEVYAVIRAAGPERCVLATDLGQIGNPSPVEGLRTFIVELMELGVTREEIDVMVCRNPARLLGLDER